MVVSFLKVEDFCPIMDGRRGGFVTSANDCKVPRLTDAYSKCRAKLDVSNSYNHLFCDK